jgi:hypothetical protein
VPAKLKPRVRRDGRAQEFAPVPPPQATIGLPEGLIQAGAVALRAALERVASSKSANSLRGYTSDWAIWCHAAEELGVEPMPATLRGWRPSSPGCVMSAAAVRPPPGGAWPASGGSTSWPGRPST